MEDSPNVMAIETQVVAKSEERRREYKRRLHRARLDGGRSIGDAERADLLGKARDVVRARWARRTGHVQAEARGEPPSPHSKASLDLLLPGHIAVPAETLLGMEIELADVLATRETVEQDRMGLLRLIARAREGVARAPMPNGPGQIDLFKLETALETGKGLPRDAEVQLLEVVRELIRWRAVAGGSGPDGARP